MTITVVRALNMATRALLRSEHPDAIEARIVLLELCAVLERYERPRVAPLMKLKLGAQATHCLWCGKRIERSSAPTKMFCCRNHRQRAYVARQHFRISSSVVFGDGHSDTAGDDPPED